MTSLKLGLLLATSMALNATSIAEIEYNKKVAYNYCNNLAGLGSMTEGVSMDRYLNTCLSLIKYPFKQMPDLETIRAELSKTKDGY